MRVRGGRAWLPNEVVRGVCEPARERCMRCESALKLHLHRLCSSGRHLRGKSAGKRGPSHACTQARHEQLE